MARPTSSSRAPAASHWIRVQLAGVKSLKLAQDAEVEIKAGALYQKRMYEGVPLLFDSAATPPSTWSASPGPTV